MIARLRLISGLTLFVFVTTHLLNHALGLFSIAAADAGLAVFAAVWRGPVGSGVLALAITVHLCLVLWAVFRRRRLRLTVAEWTQLALGLTILPLGMDHFVQTRAAHHIDGVLTAYFWVLWPMATEPWVAARQFALILVVWIHGCVGLRFWLRLKPWYAPLAPWLFGAALVLPTLAIAGVASALRDAAELLETTPDLLAVAAGLNAPGKDAVLRLYALADTLRYAVAGVIVAVLAARPLRDLWERRNGVVRLEYPGGRVVALPAGSSVLEMSRVGGVPHASICGGRGRCSTCRVRIAGPDAAGLPPPAADETRVLERIGAPHGVRLACQTRPRGGAYGVTPLLPPTTGPRGGLGGHRLALGSERIVAVMFVDLRGFTAMSEKRLPFDVVFILNRYFRSMGEAIQAAGGHIDKFIGDGIMAVFGLDSDAGPAARQALDAARRMADALADLNASLEGELAEPLRIGIGLHAGPAIVGEMGHGRTVALTAIGDTVNTASRLEGMTKELGCALVVSQELVELSEMDLRDWPRREIEIRGRTTRMAVRLVGDPGRLGVGT